MHLVIAVQSIDQAEQIVNRGRRREALQAAMSTISERSLETASVLPRMPSFWSSGGPPRLGTSYSIVPDGNDED